MCHGFKHKLCSPKTKLIKEPSVLAHLNQELSVLGTVPFVIFDDFHEFNFWANDTEYMKFKTVIRYAPPLFYMPLTG